MRQRGMRQAVSPNVSRTGADSATRAWRTAGASSPVVTCGRLAAHGQADGRRGRTPTARGRRPARRRARRAPDRPASGTTTGFRPRSSTRGVARVAGDRLRQASDLVAEPGVVDLRRRRDVGAEDAHLQALEAAHGAEALALAPGGVDGRRPVDLDAEPPRRELEAPAVDDERDGDARERGRAPLEQRLRLGRRHPRDVDARDVDAAGEPVGRAGEDEPERGRGDDADRDGEHERTRQRADDAYAGVVGSDR